MREHPDEFTLLRYVAGDLLEDETRPTESHVSKCSACSSALMELRDLDEGLRSLASTGSLHEEDPAGFSRTDPFRHRPELVRLRDESDHLPGTGTRALAASEGAGEIEERLLEAMRRPEALREVFSAISLDRPEDRFGLLYALQEAGLQIAENPLSAIDFARAAIAELQEPLASAKGEAGDAEAAVPRLVLLAQANVLAALAFLWTKEFSEAGSHLVVAYRAFVEGRGDEASLALVEMTEAQRRAFVHDGATALALARRAGATFEDLGLEDSAARALVVEGLAHFALGQQEDAIRCYRKALPVFERQQLWSNYVGALNSIATSLTTLDRLDEARREYARALRRFSQDRHRYWLGYLRIGFAETLFAGARFAEAAVSASRAARVFANAGLRVNSLIATLLEVECWARSGSISRAQHRLDLFWSDVERDRALDRAVVRELEEALSGANPDYQRLSNLREQIGETLRQRLKAKSA